MGKLIGRVDEERLDLKVPYSSHFFHQKSSAVVSHSAGRGLRREVSDGAVAVGLLEAERVALQVQL